MSHINILIGIIHLLHSIEGGGGGGEGKKFVTLRI